MGKYRDRLDIIADILTITREGAKKTKIMHQANLSYKLLEHYLKRILEAKLASKNNDNVYLITDKGEVYLETYKKYSMKIRGLQKRMKEIQMRRTILRTLLGEKTLNDKCKEKTIVLTT